MPLLPVPAMSCEYFQCALWCACTHRVGKKLSSPMSRHQPAQHHDRVGSMHVFPTSMCVRVCQAQASCSAHGRVTSVPCDQHSQW